MTLESQHDLRRLALRRYTAAEFPLLEERLVQEDGYAQRLREAEYDLIDDYAAGRLDAGERADVERHLLATADGAVQLRVARALAAARAAGAPAPDPGRVAPTPARGRRESRAMRWQALAAVVVAALAVTWQLRTVPSAGTAPGPTADAPGPSAAGPATVAAPAPEAGDAVMTVSLALDHPRGETARVIRVAAGARALRMQAEVGDAPTSERYTVEIRREGAPVPYVVRGVVPRTAGPYRFVEVDVPRVAWAAGALDVTVRDEERRDAAPPLQWRVRIDETP